jgi:ABC-type Mn2+/Zn2+ transport system permease subunit
MIITVIVAILLYLLIGFCIALLFGRDEVLKGANETHIIDIMSMCLFAWPLVLCVAAAYKIGELLSDIAHYLFGEKS